MAGVRPKSPGARPSRRQSDSAALRKLARAHAQMALQALAEVATAGSSEASRISAAMALLDRGYGKSGTGTLDEIRTPVPTLYPRIELIDGSAENSDETARAGREPAGDGQD